MRNSRREAPPGLPAIVCLPCRPTADVCSLCHLAQGTPIVPHEVEPHQRFTEVRGGRGAAGQGARRALPLCQGNKGQRVSMPG